MTTETLASLKKSIDEWTPAIIALVNGFANQHFDAITRTRDGKKQDGKKQFVDLVEAAAQACCIDEFKLYIKYKGAKEGTRSLWGGLSNSFNVKIDELMKEVADKIEKAIGNLQAMDSEIIKLEVLKRFCGYLMWRTHADISAGGGQ